jgi:hypothetical protein
VKKGSSSFLKKRTKKLLDIRPSFSGEAEAKTIESFLLLFFKKEGLAFGVRVMGPALRAAPAGG